MKRSYFVGVDLHKTVIQVCILNSAGQPVRRGEFRVTGEGTEAADLIFRRLRSLKSVIVAVEALGLNRWFVDRCRSFKIPILVVDATKLSLKASGKKTDRRDAAEIARRLYLGDLERCARTYYPSAKEYGKRKIERARHFLVQQRQSIVNQIRAILNAYRLPAPRGVLYTGPSLEKLRALEVPGEDLEEVYHILLDILEHHQEQIHRLDARIRDRARECSKAQILQETVPSVGSQTAVTILAEFGDLRRFRNSRAAASYAGLVPRVANSADRKNHGRLAPQGNRQLRWIFCQMAVRLLSTDILAKRWAVPRLKRMHKNKVRVALARRLVVGVYHMLTTGEVFDLRRCLAA